MLWEADFVLFDSRPPGGSTHAKLNNLQSTPPPVCEPLSRSPIRKKPESASSTHPELSLNQFSTALQRIGHPPAHACHCQHSTVFSSVPWKEPAPQPSEFDVRGRQSAPATEPINTTSPSGATSFQPKQDLVAMSVAKGGWTHTTWCGCWSGATDECPSAPAHVHPREVRPLQRLARRADLGSNRG